MPIIVKAKKSDSTSDLIKKFKKQVAINDIVQICKDRRYYQKPSKAKSMSTAQNKRLRKRMRSLKKMKNTPATVIEKITERLN